MYYVDFSSFYMYRLTGISSTAQAAFYNALCTLNLLHKDAENLHASMIDSKFFVRLTNRKTAYLLHYRCACVSFQFS